MKVLAWNIQSGGGRRIGRIVEAIARHNPDVAVISEFKHGSSGHELAAGLSRQGLSHHSPPADESGMNTVFIASRLPIHSVTRFPNPEVARHLLQVEIAGLRIIGCYFPQKNEKKPVFDRLLTMMKESDGPCLVTGDLNTGRNPEDSEGAPFYCADYFGAFEPLGFHDLWVRQHGKKREFTWYHTSGNGMRIDHALGSRSLLPRVADVSYSHAERTVSPRVSDHSVMLVQLD